LPSQHNKAKLDKQKKLKDSIASKDDLRGDFSASGKNESAGCLGDQQKGNL